MASITVYKGGFRAQVFILGVRDSKTFRTKREATAWGSARETEIRRREAMLPGDLYTLADLFDNYMKMVVENRKNPARETRYINFFRRELPLDITVSQADSLLFSDYRDRRVKVVKDATVLREMKVLSVIFEEARKEWKWIATNPIKEIRKPSSSPHRERIITWSEIRAMLGVIGRNSRLGLAFLIALRSGMRAGEICGLTWARVSENEAYLPDTKTTPRRVPVTKKLRRLFDRAQGKHSTLVLGISARTLSRSFIDARAKAGLSGFTFHDSRHTAATWIAHKVDVMTLCKIFGWSNPKQAMVYYNPSSANIAKMLER
jgi:integrase